MKQPSDHTAVGDVRAPALLWVLVLSVAPVCGAILYLTAYRNFFYDEWAWLVSRRGWDSNTLLFSHGGHWSTLPVLAWKLLFLTVGIRSHIPYEAVLLVVHAIVVLLLFAVVRRRAGDLPAFAAAVVALVPGFGADDITWAFQLAWVGSVAFGLLALLWLDGNPRFTWLRVVGVSAALLGSLMCSSVGVVFVALLGIELVFDRQRWQFLVVLVVPILAFGAWFLIYDTGRIAGSPGVAGSLLKGANGSAYALSILSFTWLGLQATAAGLLGLVVSGPLPLAVLCCFLAWHFFRQRSILSWELAVLVAVPFWFALIGLGRVQLGVDQAQQARYLYVAGIIALPLLAFAARELPWRGPWRPFLVFSLAAVLLGNVTLLVDRALNLVDFMSYEDTALQTTEVFRNAPDMNLDRHIDIGLIPEITPRTYFGIVDALGSPVPPATVDTLRSRPTFIVDRVMRNEFGDSLTISPDNQRPTQGMTCETDSSTQGLSLQLQIPSNESFMLQASGDASASFFLGFLDPVPATPLKQTTLRTGTREWVHLPNTGKAIVWQLRVDVQPVASLQICSTPHYQISQSGTYSARAASFTLGRGWAAVPDVNAATGTAARAAAGTAAASGAFGAPFVPSPGQYDVWYRVRVASTRSTNPEMLLSLTDVTRNAYMVARVYRASDLTTTYTWVLVESAMSPIPGDLMRFQANSGPTLSTDWYIDTAVMLPAGSAVPGA